MVSKTGRAEISEDPMGPEQTDVFVMLKPRRSFGGSRSRAELAEVTRTRGMLLAQQGKFEDAVVELTGPGGDRTMAVHDFMVGVKRTALADGELITAVTVPLLDGWQGYSKVGVRNAMVIATASADSAFSLRTRTTALTNSNRSTSCATRATSNSPS